MAPFPCPALLVAKETCICSQHQRSRLLSCGPLGPNPISVSISGELCLSVGLPGMAGSWLPGRRACGSHRMGQGDVWTQALDLRAASVAQVEGLGAPHCSPAWPLDVTEEHCWEAPRGGRPAHEHRKNACWQQGATGTCCRHVHSPAGGLGPPGEGTGTPTLRGLERERAGPAAGVGWPQAAGHMQGRGLGQRERAHRNS